MISRTGKIIWRIIFRTCVTVAVAAGLLVLSYVVFPDWWEAQILKFILEVERLEPAATDEAAAARMDSKIKRLMDPETVFGNEAWEATELEINSLINRRMNEEKAKLGNGDPNPADATVIAGSLSEIQVDIEKGVIKIACNVDIKRLAPLIEERFGRELPQDVPESTVLRATVSATVEDRVLKVNFNSLKLGKVDLRDYIYSESISELTDELETHLRDRVRSQIPGRFEEINEDEISYRLPENVDDVQILKNKIRIRFREQPE